MSLNSVVCFGELLWDILPSGKQPGGAPMNVAFHLNNFGFDVNVVSKVGHDSFGNDIISIFKEYGINTASITTTSKYATGKVNVQLNPKGIPSYEILHPAAWDFIELDKESSSLIKNADILVYGSLSTRNIISRNALLKSISLAKLKILDINLRKPFYSEEIISELLHHANILKLNDDELEVLSNWFHIEGDLKQKLSFIKNEFKLDQICLTIGEKGAYLYNGNKIYHSVSKKITVEDTIGSGDAFLAAYIFGLTKNFSPQKTLDLAVAVGGFIASTKGAMNTITPQGAIALIN